MRVRILLAVLVLLIFAGIARYFADDLRQLWQPRYHATAQEEQKLADAREKLPFVSVSARLPKGRPIRPAKALSAEAQAQWEEMEKWHARIDRTEMLKALHEKTRNVFVDRPGAGKGRMLETPEEILLDEYDDKH